MNDTNVTPNTFWFAELSTENTPQPGLDIVWHHVSYLSKDKPLTTAHAQAIAFTPEPIVNITEQTFAPDIGHHVHHVKYFDTSRFSLTFGNPPELDSLASIEEIYDIKRVIDRQWQRPVRNDTLQLRKNYGCAHFIASRCNYELWRSTENPDDLLVILQTDLISHGDFKGLDIDAYPPPQEIISKQSYFAHDTELGDAALFRVITDSAILFDALTTQPERRTNLFYDWSRNKEFFAKRHAHVFAARPTIEQVIKLRGGSGQNFGVEPPWLN